jgi:hypothetical protein
MANTDGCQRANIRLVSFQSVKRSSSAHSRTTTTTTTTNHALHTRSRSQSLTGSGRQLSNSSTTSAVTSRSSIKGKSNKSMNPSNTSKTTVSNTVGNNLLGQVDLDDDDSDLLMKFDALKKNPIVTNSNDEKAKKMSSAMQSIIDTRWNVHEKSSDRSDNDDDMNDEFYTMASTRQRTSSRSSTMQTKAIVTSRPLSMHHKQVE